MAGGRNIVGRIDWSRLEHALDMAALFCQQRSFFFYFIIAIVLSAYFVRVEVGECHENLIAAPSHRHDKAGSRVDVDHQSANDQVETRHEKIESGTEKHVSLNEGQTIHVSCIGKTAECAT